jgi:prepilin-type N-terminal cleavage/methylation domain-containing protein
MAASRSVRRNKGFSLLELVVTVGILSVGIIIVVESFIFSARTAVLSCDMIRAIFLAEDKIQELQFKERQHLLSSGLKENQGRSDKFDWAYRLIPLADVGLYSASVPISWQGMRRKEKLAFGTYLRQ